MFQRVQTFAFRVFAIATAVLSLFSGTMTTIAFAHTVSAQSNSGGAVLKAAHVGASNPGHKQGQCTRAGWGWHFLLPGDDTDFVSIAISFQAAGTITSFESHPNANHAYVYTPGPDTVLSGSAITAGGTQSVFVLSHICPGADVAPTAVPQPSATPQPTATPGMVVIAPIETAQPTTAPVPTATQQPDINLQPIVSAPVETAVPAATQLPEQSPTIVPTDVPTPSPEQSVVTPQPTAASDHSRTAPPSRPELPTIQPTIATPEATQTPAPEQPEPTPQAPEQPAAQPTIVIAPAVSLPPSPPAQPIEPEAVAAPPGPQVPGEVPVIDEQGAPASVTDPVSSGAPLHAVVDLPTSADNPPPASSWGTAPAGATSRGQVAEQDGATRAAQVAPAALRSELPVTGPNDVLFWLGATLAAAVMAVGCGIQSRQLKPVVR